MSVHDYAALTSPEAGDAAERGGILLLPVGAVEQHGHALPLGTDNYRAEGVARRLAAELGDRASVLPTLPYGISPHHSTLPGTVSLPGQLFIDLVISVASQLADQGFSRILVINGHGGNNSALGVIQQQLLALRPRLAFAWAPITGLAPKANATLGSTEVTGHSGESETAQLMALNPELVHADRLSPGATALDDLAPLPRLSRHPKIKVAVTFDRYADNGVLGDPTAVTAEDGERVLAEAIAELREFAEALLELETIPA